MAEPLSSEPTIAAGKAGRARLARMGVVVDTSRSGHRARGGAPVNVLPEHQSVVEALEAIERRARLRCHPELVERAPVPMDCHGSMEEEAPSEPADGEAAPGTVVMRGRQLREFSLALLPEATGASLASSITALDLSRNELWELPGIEALQGLRELDISRNWFAALPTNAGVLVLANAAADEIAFVAHPHRPQLVRFEEGRRVRQAAVKHRGRHVVVKGPQLVGALARLALGGSGAGGVRVGGARVQRGRRRVEQQIAGGRDLGEALSGLVDIVRVLVGVPLDRELLERPLDLVGVLCAGREPEHGAGLVDERLWHRWLSSRSGAQS